MKSSSQTLWFWTQVLFFIGVVGWLVVFTGSAILLEMVLYFALHLASIPEPYLRLEGQTYSWITVIRWCGSFAIWFFYGKWVWKKLIRRKSVISDGEDSEGKGDQREKSLQEKNFLRDPGYKGEYKNGKFHGEGTFTYENGTTYTGKWKDGLPHGKGTQRSPNGRTLAGQWKSGEFLGESPSKKVAKKSVSASNRSKRTSSDSGSNKLANPKQKAIHSSRKKRDAGVERIDFEEFMSRTMGGGPVYADMSIYEGKPFKCGCGSEHLFNEKQCGVLRELRGMHFVIGCPDKDYLNYVKITLLKLKTKFSTTVDPSQKLSSDSGSTESAKPIGEINRHATGNPSTPSSVSSSTREKLEELKSLLDDSLINAEDYEKKKNDLLSKM